jgi:hypothetical protein
MRLCPGAASHHESRSAKPVFLAELCLVFASRQFSFSRQVNARNCHGGDDADEHENNTGDK